MEGLPALRAFLVCLLLVCLTDRPALVAGSMGRDFYVAFMETAKSFSFTNLHPTLTIINPNAADIQVQIEYSSLASSPANLTLNVSDSYVTTLSTDVIMMGAKKHEKHVRVTSAEDFYLYCQVDHRTYRKVSLSGFMVLPTPELTSEYITATYCVTEKCVVVITCVEDNTTVTIALRILPARLQASYNGTHYSDDDTITESLNAGESMQVTCFTCDLTGSWVKATKKVAVFSGGQNTIISHTSTHTWSDAVSAQLSGGGALGREYVVGAGYPGLRGTVRVVVLQAGQHVTLNTTTHTATRPRDVFTFPDQDLQGVTPISGSGPLMVMEVVYAERNRNPDLSMNLPPPRHLWSTAYLVHVPGKGSTVVCVVLPSVQPGAGIVVNGGQPDSQDKVQDGNYTLLKLTFNGGGTRDIHSTPLNGAIPFWAFAIYSKSYQASSHVLPALHFAMDHGEQMTPGDINTTAVTTALTTMPVTTDLTSLPVTTLPVTTDVTSTPVTTDPQNTSSVTTDPQNTSSVTTTENDITYPPATSETNTPASSAQQTEKNTTPIQTSEDGVTAPVDITTPTDVTTGKDVTTHRDEPRPPAGAVQCCRCVKDAPSSLSSEEREEAMSEARAAIKAELQTDRHSLSSYVRSKQSAPDPRLASAIVGSTVGIACFAVIFGFLIGSDVITLLRRFTRCKTHR